MTDYVSCDHPTLFFGSGDYYIFCQNCHRKWVMCCQGFEYGTSATGEAIGATPQHTQGRPLTTRSEIK